MKHRTSDLIGPELDLTVARICGLSAAIECLPWKQGVSWVGELQPRCFVRGWKAVGFVLYEPSVSWEHGGPLIESEKISIYHDGGKWNAGLQLTATDGHSLEMDHWQTGPTPLVAAMRAFVASKLGEEVELP